MERDFQHGWARGPPCKDREEEQEQEEEQIGIRPARIDDLTASPRLAISIHTTDMVTYTNIPRTFMGNKRCGCQAHCPHACGCPTLPFCIFARGRKIRNVFVTRSEANGLRIWHEHSQRPRISKPVCYPFGGRLALKFARALPEAAKIRNLFVTRSEANGLRIWHQSGM